MRMDAHRTLAHYKPWSTEANGPEHYKRSWSLSVQVSSTMQGMLIALFTGHIVSCLRLMSSKFIFPLLETAQPTPQNTRDRKRDFLTVWKEYYCWEEVKSVFNHHV